MTLYDQHL